MGLRSLRGQNESSPLSRNTVSPVSTLDGGRDGAQTRGVPDVTTTQEEVDEGRPTEFFPVQRYPSHPSRYVTDIKGSKDS